MVKVKITDMETEGNRKPSEPQEGSSKESSEGEKESPKIIEGVPYEEMSREQLLQNINQLEETSRRNFDLYVRSQAEIENMKKRFQKEKSELTKYCNESLIRALLPIMDNLEKALAHAQSEKSAEAIKEGVELTLKGMRDTLVKSGLEEVKALGEAFDPSYHEAMYEKVDNCVEAGTVVEEYQKGYLLNQRLLRPAMVVVSKNDQANEDATDL